MLKYIGVGSHGGLWYYPIFVTVLAVFVVSSTSTRGEMRPVVLPMYMSVVTFDVPSIYYGMQTHTATITNGQSALGRCPLLVTSSSIGPA